MDECNKCIIVDDECSLFKIVMKYGATFNNKDEYILLGCDTKKDYELILGIPEGITKIDYKGDKIILEYSKSKKIVGDSNGVLQKKRVKIYGKDMNILKNFIHDSRKYYLPNKKKDVIVRIMRGHHWFKLSSLPKRPIDTVFLDNHIKDDLIKDIDLFLKNEDNYVKRGIPYKRNYLLSGPPGTGKTSFIFSIASLYNLDVCIVNLGPNVDDVAFMTSVSNLPDNSILVLEDVDSLFIERDSSSQNKSFVTFSCILNILDGIGRKHKLMTFMTSNFKDKFDKALIRPGRIDKQVTFDYASKSQSKKMFLSYFPEQSDKFNLLWKKIKYKKYTTAILQSFFFNNVGSEDIMKEIDKLIETGISKDGISSALYS
tara:strand:- start:75 stop:1190 length:1116 start_codon:yes stop_codon:yes gene_type:complete